jgi:NADPH:quinone reductase-like Zn-dependent oxidoreductase
VFPKAEADELVMRSTLLRGLEQWLKESGLTQTQGGKAGAEGPSCRAGQGCRLGTRHRSWQGDGGAGHCGSIDSKSNAENYEQLGARHADGTICPVIADEVKEVPAALARLRRRQVVGKIVVLPEK